MFLRYGGQKFELEFIKIDRKTEIGKLIYQNFVEKTKKLLKPLRFINKLLIGTVGQIENLRHFQYVFLTKINPKNKKKWTTMASKATIY